MTLDDSYKLKMNQISMLIRSDVDNYKKQLTNKLNTAEQTLSNLHNNRLDIEQSIKKNEQSILQRLHDIETSQINSLLKQEENIKQHISKIQQLITKCYEFGNLHTNQDMIQFLNKIQYNNLINSIHKLSEPLHIQPPKPIDLSILPTETANQLSALKNIEHLQSTLQEKDDALQSTLLNRQQLIASQEQQSSGLHNLWLRAQNEIQEWIELTTQLSNELLQYRSICTFCNMALSGNNANTKCIGNQPTTTNSSSSNPTLRRSFHRLQNVKINDTRFVGDGLHFFVKTQTK
jgi:hypothetical protein